MQVSISNHLQTKIWYRYRSTSVTSITLSDARFDLGKDVSVGIGQTSNRIYLSTTLNTVIFVWVGDNPKPETNSNAALLLNRTGGVLQNKTDGTTTLVSIEKNKWAATPTELTLENSNNSIPTWVYVLLIAFAVLILFIIIAAYIKNQRSMVRTRGY